MLTSEQFKFHLARYAKVKEEDASAFMEAVTQVLLEKVQAGEEVTIQGLGTFVVIDSQQGRRLGFQVDETMRKAVNAPFACFEPMTLAAEMRKRQTEPAAVEPTPEEPVSEPAVEEPVQTEETPASEESPVSEESPEEVSIPEEAQPAVEEQPVEEAPEEEPAPIEEEETPSVDEPAPEPEETVSEEEESPVSEGSPEEDSIPEEPQPAPEEVSEEQPAPVAEAVAMAAVASETPEAKAEPAPEIPAPAQPKPTPTRTKRPVEPTFGEQLQKYWLMFKEGKSEPWMWGVLAVVVLVLILLIWLLIPSGKKKEKVEPAPVETVAAAPADSTQSQVETPVETPKAEAPKPTPVAKSGKKASRPTDDMLWMENGQPKTGKLGNGGRLTLLALRNYGDKAFWAYIYDVNAYQLGDPNNVPIGKPLYLPNPKYFGIDANDPNSIKKAQVRAMQILREWESK